MNITLVNIGLVFLDIILFFAFAGACLFYTKNAPRIWGALLSF